jgi:hypothetical protein
MASAQTARGLGSGVPLLDPGAHLESTGDTENTAQTPGLYPNQAAHDDLPILQQDLGPESLLDVEPYDDTYLGFDTSQWLLESDFLNGLEDLQQSHFEPRDERLPDVPRLHDLSEIWYVPVTERVGPLVQCDPDSSTQDNRHRETIDEAYRANLASRLVPSIRDEPLPSIAFLVSTSDVSRTHDSQSSS